jgi:hypothetical protein
MSKRTSKGNGKNTVATDKPSESASVNPSSPMQTLSVEEAHELVPMETEEDAAPQSVPNPDWSKIKRIDSNSLKARWEFEKWAVIRELWRANGHLLHEARRGRP